MSAELERARAHLFWEQQRLAMARKLLHVDVDLGDKERAVLAALSWVWEEQEKTRQADMVEIELGWRRIGPGSYVVDFA